VIDWQREDFTPCGEQFDLVFDALGKSSFAACRSLLVPGGAYLSTELGPWGQNPVLGLVGPVLARAGVRRVMFPLPAGGQAMIVHLAELMETGEFTPVIDREYALDQVAEAFRYVESGQKTGNVVLRVS